MSGVKPLEEPNLSKEVRELSALVVQIKDRVEETYRKVVGGPIGSDFGEEKDGPLVSFSISNEVYGAIKNAQSASDTIETLNRIIGQ